MIATGCYWTAEVSSGCFISEQAKVAQVTTTTATHSTWNMRLTRVTSCYSRRDARTGTDHRSFQLGRKHARQSGSQLPVL